MLQLTQMISTNAAILRLRYVIGFALFVAARNWLLPVGNGNTEGHALWASLTIDLAIAVAVIGVVVYSTRRRYMSPQDWGLGFSRGVWWYVGIICAIGVYFAIRLNEFGWSGSIISLSIVLRVFTYELVLRAAGLHEIKKALVNRTVFSIGLALVINAFIYSVALAPLDSFTGITVGNIVVLSCCYLYMRSILLTAFSMAAYAVPDAGGAWVAMFSLLIYLGLSAVLQHPVFLSTSVDVADNKS